MGAGAWSTAADVEHTAVIDETPSVLEPIPAEIDLAPGLPDHPDLPTGDGTGEPSADLDDPGLTSRTNLDAEISSPAAALGLDEIDLTDDEPEPEPTPAPTADDGVHGNPVAWTLNWFYQQVDGYCGPSAVAQVVAQYTGETITDPQLLVDRATELGLMGDPAEGMSLPNIEALLEDQGVSATLTDGSLDDLRERLDNGYGVIAMVDSGEIWHPDQESGEDDTADHVLVVAGIDDTRGVVILSDPGVPSGNQLEVPIEQFEDAWADSGHQMLVTDAPDDGLIDRPRRAAVPVDRSAIIRLGPPRR
ncbi:hypothetical protein FK531_00375 [Rhodococcus spelaei]|uniref:Peptidase C39-like domain-containing protein n=2 Tax=Rhodococcus spelaei TaxID=2546320 RepID=A0A541BS91_9NOCA|nr:hypothetical protein FK531_00375 [Rhodococcus spelaei]